MKAICQRLILLSLMLFWQNKSCATSSMFVHFIDVGQGSAVLLEFPCGVVLIDAGAQDVSSKEHLIQYLTTFFSSKQQFQNTLDLVIITHPHKDHNDGLDKLAAKFTVKKYIDYGWQDGSGGRMQVWMQQFSSAHHIPYTNYSFEEISKGDNKSGVDDTLIDPINCETIDPGILVYSGRFDNKPDTWSQTDWDNFNNHSLVIKIKFGSSSFLFTGDLEKKGLEALIDLYRGTSALDVDVLMVGHHGAENAITEDFLHEVTPKYAIISCGHWDYGLHAGDAKLFNTNKYGHPRVSTIALLAKHISGYRPRKISVQAAEGSANFRKMWVSKNIYATAWDETVIVKATDTGLYQVTTHN